MVTLVTGAILFNMLFNINCCHRHLFRPLQPINIIRLIYNISMDSSFSTTSSLVTLIIINNILRFHYEWLHSLILLLIHFHLWRLHCSRETLHLQQNCQILFDHIPN